MNNEIERLKEKIKEYELLIEELSAPIIPSIIPDTMLVPLMGTLTEQRFQLIQCKILNAVVNEHADAVLIDFTGINLEDINRLGLDGVSHQISQLKKALDIMGVETIFVGFSPEFVRVIVTTGVDVTDFCIHATFRTALRYIMDKKNLDLQSV